MKARGVLMWTTVAIAIAVTVGLSRVSGRAPAAGQAEPGRIAHAPTKDALPAAVLGAAPAPRGQALAYMPGDGKTTGYLALPAGAGKHPALILVHEWNGLNDRVRQVADAFAAEGYVALAADLFQGRTGSNPEQNMALVKETQGNMPRVVENLNTAAKYLRGRSDTTGKIGVMGWCFGGGIALSYGIDGDAHDATAMFYGQLVQDPARLKRIHHAIYGTFAGQDQGIPPGEVRKFVEALRTAGIQNDVHIYDEMVHGFWLWVDQDPEKRRAPALDSWQRLKAYLARTVGDGKTQ